MKLTKAQERAKAKLTTEWQCAYTLQESLPTLEGLVSRKVAIMKRDALGATYSPRTSVHFKLSSNALWHIIEEVESTDTSALSAAIAGQQKEIDRLRLMEKNNNERWQHENKSVERMALAAFSVLNHPESPECHFELKQAVMAMGFCPHCEWRPCECEGQYDD